MKRLEAAGYVVELKSGLEVTPTKLVHTHGSAQWHEQGCVQLFIREPKTKSQQAAATWPYFGALTAFSPFSLTRAFSGH